MTVNSNSTPNPVKKPVHPSFKDLKIIPPVLKALHQHGYDIPTPVQIQAIPIIQAGHDIIARAPTGTGKTAAFVLPSLEIIAESASRIKPQILILTPTRELATQITDNIYKFGKELRINAISILGGMPYREQLRKLSRPNDILIATPGRLIDYLERGDIDLSAIKIFVLDEADRMLDMGFIEDVEYISAAMPKNRQTLLFTATLGNKLVKLAHTILKSPKLIDVDENKMTLDKIKQSVYLADDKEHKNRLLRHILKEANIYKAIIFSATKRNADDLATSLCREGHAAQALHGDMRQPKRDKTISLFKNGKIEILVATDVASRGIHVEDVTHVINYDLSKLAADYVHRIGRTGRAGKTGIAISLVTAIDHINLKRIEQLLKQSIARSVITGLEPKTNFTSSSSSSSNANRSGSSRHRSSQPQRSNAGYRSGSSSGYQNSRSNSRSYDNSQTTTTRRNGNQANHENRTHARPAARTRFSDDRFSENNTYSATNNRNPHSPHPKSRSAAPARSAARSGPEKRFVRPEQKRKFRDEN